MSNIDPRSRVFAIDPGITGAWAVLGWKGEFLGTGDMPRFAKLINGVELANEMRSWAPETVVIERVGARPGQGVTSMFSFGTSFGIAIGIACGYGTRIVYTTPNEWKRYFRLPSANKDASREKAIQLFPEASKYLVRKRDHGRADALLIAKHFLDKTGLDRV